MSAKVFKDYTVVRMIESLDWDKLVSETYSKPYCFQKQDGCRSEGMYKFSIPSSFELEEEEMSDTIDIGDNEEQMGVKFKEWLATEPKEGKREREFWEERFYPNIETLANDLHQKGILEAGFYAINICF